MEKQAAIHAQALDINIPIFLQVKKKSVHFVLALEKETAQDATELDE